MPGFGVASKSAAPAALSAVAEPGQGVDHAANTLTASPWVQGQAAPGADRALGPVASYGGALRWRAA